MSLESLEASVENIVKDQLLESFKNYINSQKELSLDNFNVMKILPYILKLQNQKSLIYGRSYCKHGDFSIFLNTERKWDRISNIMENAMREGVEKLYSDESSTPTETFVDTVVDLASYALLWIGWIYENHPTEFENFVSSNGLSFDMDDTK